jgi:hypothetical protein
VIAASDQSMMPLLAVELEDVLGTEVGVGDDPLRRWSWAAGMQHADELAGAIEVSEPCARVGVVSGDQVCDCLRIDAVQVTKEPAQSPCGARRRRMAEHRLAGDSFIAPGRPRRRRRTVRAGR